MNAKIPEFIKDIDAKLDANPNLVLELLGLDAGKPMTESKEADTNKMFESVYEETNKDDK